MGDLKGWMVMIEILDTNVETKERSKRLLDEVDFISSVSGGSFTAAYYGLYGDRIFDDFEEVFLRRDVEGKLVRGVLNPLGEGALDTGKTGHTIFLPDQFQRHPAS